MRRILVYRRNYLPKSETFIYEQLIGHQLVKPVVLTRRKPVNLDQFPFDEIYVRRRLSKLKSWLKKQNIECIHARFGPAGLELLDAAKQSGIPLITSFHGFDATKLVKTNAKYRASLKRLFRHGQAFTVVSEDMKRKLVRLGCPAEKIHLVRSGIDLFKFPLQPLPDVSKQKFRLLSVGRLTEKKGMDTLIKAFRYVRWKYPRATLTIVGEGKERAKLQRLIGKYKLQRHVTLTGALSHREVQEELRKCHLFVIACKRAKNGDQEGIPNVIMEAMATGRPVISTYHAGIPELVKHRKTGFLVPEKAPRKLAGMINRVLAEREKWPDIIAEARNSVEQHHNISKQRAELEALYLQLIEKER
jgi:colanic acid/amylovoran biosynthesis glycosyltransferase